MKIEVSQINKPPRPFQKRRSLVEEKKYRGQTVSTAIDGVKSYRGSFYFYL